MKIGKKIKKLFSKHVRGILLNTGWFEYKVASLLYNCDLTLESNLLIII